MELCDQKIQNILSSIGTKSETELENKLTDVNLSLEEYLKNPEAIQCFLNMKENAQKYFDKDKIKKLIKYIIEIPKENEYDKGYKYPYIACEMLKSANSRIKEMIIFPEEDFNIKYTKENKDNKNNIDVSLKISNNKEEINEESRGENIEEKDENDNVKEINSDKHEIKKIRKFNVEKHCELFDLFLDFLKNEQSLKNDVLCGYFYKVISSLIDSYPIDIFLYLFLIRQDALKEIVMHSYNKSLSLISINILNINNYIYKISQNEKKNPGMISNELLKEKEKSMKDFRLKILEELITSIDLYGLKDIKKGFHIDNIDLENIFLMFEELYKIDDIKYDLVYNNNIKSHIFKLLDKNVFFQNEKVIYNERKIYLLFTHLLTNILRELPPQYQSENKFYPEYNIGFLIKHLKQNEYLDFAEKVITSMLIILSSHFIPTSRENVLGIHNIYLMDLVLEFYNYLSKKPNTFDFIVLQTNFVDKSIEFFFEYQLNDIYHFKFNNLFTLYLQNGENHPLLTDYFFIKKKFHIRLAMFLDNKKDKKHEENLYKYKSGNKILSTLYIFIIDLMYKIQIAAGLELLDEKTRKDLNINNYGYFEFLRDEKTPKKMEKLKLPSYIGDILSKSKEWINAIQNIVIPKIKKYEGKLVCTQPIKPKSNSNNVNIISNTLNLNVSDSIKVNTEKSEESISDYNDVNFWKINETVFEEIKGKIDSYDNKSEKIEENYNDDEDKLLYIAMKLEKKEKENKKK